MVEAWLGRARVEAAAAAIRGAPLNVMFESMYVLRSAYQTTVNLGYKHPIQTGQKGAITQVVLNIGCHTNSRIC